MDINLFINRFEAELIQSRNNPFVMAAAKLSVKKYRDEARTFLAEGVKLSREAIEYANVECVAFSESAVKKDSVMAEIAESAKEIGARIILLSDSAFEKISTEQSPQGVIALVKYCSNITQNGDFDAWQRDRRILILDQVRDPGNIGTILRSAEALGIGGVILSGCADLYGSKTVRSAMGTLFRLPVYVTSDLIGCVETLKKNARRVFSAALGEHTYTLGRYEIRKDDCIVIGNEGHGVSAEVIAASTACVRIPMVGNTESLNASAAAACVLWEYFR